MSEVAIVAAITGGTSVLTSGITALVTWKISNNSSSVELAKAAAENERLQQGNREEERRNRQSTYHQFVDALTSLYQAVGTKRSEAEVSDICDDYTHLVAGVLIFGPPAVRDGADEVNDVYAKVWAEFNREGEDNPSKPYPEKWCDATISLKDEFGEKISALMDLMHEDVTRGIAD